MGYMRIMEKKMETTIAYTILGVYRGWGARLGMVVRGSTNAQVKGLVRVGCGVQRLGCTKRRSQALELMVLCHGLQQSRTWGICQMWDPCLMSIYGWLSKLWSLLGTLRIRRRILIEIQKKDHKVDNHPYERLYRFGVIFGAFRIDRCRSCLLEVFGDLGVLHQRGDTNPNVPRSFIRQCSGDCHNEACIVPKTLTLNP